MSTFIEQFHLLVRWINTIESRSNSINYKAANALYPFSLNQLMAFGLFWNKLTETEIEYHWFAF